MAGDLDDLDRVDPPADDPEALCPMCGPMPCRHSTEEQEDLDARPPVR
jgi:hypothetical protein